MPLISLVRLAMACSTQCATAEAAAGIQVIMLTVDNRTTANAVAQRLGIADVEAEVLSD